VFHKELTNN